MKHTLPLASAVTLACLVLSGSGTAKGKPVSDTIGTAVFRCNNPPTCPADVPDRILGDGNLANYLGFGVADTGYGTHLDAANEMWIGVRSSNPPYKVTFDFRDPVGDAPCAAPSPPNCRWKPEWSFWTTEADIHSNVLLPDTPNEVEAPNGLLDVPLYQTLRARFNIAFPDPDPDGRNVGWRLNFRTYDYPGATNLSVKRTNECTWEFEAGEDDRAGLSSWGNIGKGKNTRTNEGLFKMPFKITFQIPGCVP